MGLGRTLHFKSPVTGEDRTVVVRVDLHEVEHDGVTVPALVASSGRLRQAVPIRDLLDTLLDGRFSGVYGDLTGTWLTAKATAGATQVTVADTTGFTDGDPIAVFNHVDGGFDPASVEYHQIQGPPGASTIDIGSILAQTRYEGAQVVNLRGREFAGGRGLLLTQGVRAQLEAPSPPTVEVAQAAGDTLDVTITPRNEVASAYFDIYVRDAAFTRVEPEWLPDLADQADVGSALNVSTFNAGADVVPDGAGGVLGSAQTVWVAAVAKDATGQRNVRESIASNVVKITLD